jgi:SAM-dependent methyltransferase
VSFKDHFSQRAALYATYRPHYPNSLFEFLAGLPSGHRLALDCGTGNGQAALGLAAHFDQVVATDPSEAQIRNATLHPRIEYRIASADASGLPSGSANLVTAAQALHWFDAASFFAEARRVIVEGGAIAVWGYGDPILDTRPLHQTLHEFNRGTLATYWSPERDLLLNGYRDVDFPFEEVAAPTLDLEMRWSLPELTGYMRTWSAAARYIDKHGTDPVIEAERALAADWGDPDTARLIRWPLYIRAGRR